MVDTIAVPVEPTEAMLRAGADVPLYGQFYPGHTADESEAVNERFHAVARRGQIYRAMLAAAPTPGEQADPAPSVAAQWGTPKMCDNLLSRALRAEAELRNWLDANDGLSKTAACIRRTRALLASLTPREKDPT